MLPLGWYVLLTFIVKVASLSKPSHSGMAQNSNVPSSKRKFEETGKVIVSSEFVIKTP